MTTASFWFKSVRLWVVTCCTQWSLKQAEGQKRWTDTYHTKQEALTFPVCCCSTLSTLNGGKKKSVFCLCAAWMRAIDRCKCAVTTSVMFFFFTRIFLFTCLHTQQSLVFSLQLAKPDPVEQLLVKPFISCIRCVGVNFKLCMAVCHQCWRKPWSCLVKVQKIVEIWSSQTFRNRFSVKPLLQ